MVRREWDRLGCANQMNEEHFSETKLGHGSSRFASLRGILCTTLPTIRSTINTVALVQAGVYDQYIAPYI